MKTLIIPDVHEQYGRLRAILDVYEPSVDRVVFLGDYFDSFDHKLQNVQYLCRWLVKAIENPKYTFLLGNHDQHYFTHRYGRCGGYKTETQRYIYHHFSMEMIRKFRPWTWVGNDILCSHAGLTDVWVRSVGWELPDIKASLLKYEQEYDGDITNVPIVGAVGYVRGGRDPRPGVLWCDWNGEFTPYPGLRQIMGHTMDSVPRWYPLHTRENLCVDTGLNHIVVVDSEADADHEITVVSVRNIPATPQMD